MNTIKHTNKKISIIAPFFNEEESLPIFLEEVLNIVEELGEYNFEIIFIDDGSTDNSLVFLKEKAKKNKNIIVLELSRNFGKEPALTAGIDQSNGDAVIPFDADLQDPVDVISILIKEWEKGYDVVTAKRLDRSNESFFKRITAQLFYKFHNYLSPIKIPENVGDFRLMDKKVVNAINSLDERDSVLIIDDLIATGGTAEAAAKLVEISEAKVAAFVFVINLFDLGGSDNLTQDNYKVESLIDFPGH